MISKRRLKEQLAFESAKREECGRTCWELSRENDRLSSKCGWLEVDLLKAKNDNHAMRNEIIKLIKKIFPSESFVDMFKLN